MTDVLNGRQLAEVSNALKRLAAYEDCGRLPEEVSEICKSGGQYLSGVELANIACALMKLREYQEAEEQGLLVRLPCKVRTPIFELYKGKIKETWVDMIDIGGEMMWLHLARNVIVDAKRLGKDLFLTREEAEQALEQNGG